MADHSGDLVDSAPPVLTREDLLQVFRSGEKPADAWRMGSEHEKLVFRRGDLSRPAYAGPDGIEALLSGLRRFGWAPVEEPGAHGPVLIGLTRDGPSGLENVSLEPGGQFELSGAPLADVHQVAAETRRHLEEVREVGDALDLGVLGLGHDPLHTRAQVPVMPKGRYAIMRAYMPKVGALGLDMMLRTCTVQTNLDFADEADMVAKFRTSLALQPVATALFANSPFVEGRPTGWLSSRARVWTDTDADRTGLLDFVFQDGFGYAAYADYALDVPMYFVRRDGRYLDLAGRSFRAFQKGELAELPGERPTAKDWADHLTTAFPEVRLKGYLEMRGADAGSEPMLNALSALWAGVLYDADALAAAWELARGWSRADREALRVDAARLGLKAQVAGRSLQDVAQDMVALAREGLARRARPGGGLADETPHLAPLEEIAATGFTQADRLLDLYHGPWEGDVRHAYTELAYR